MFHLTLVSQNGKIGPIPASVSSSETCPPSCPLRDKGCYAKYGPLMLHWRKVSEGLRGASWNNFVNAIKGLPRGQLWRHNQAGDLPGHGEDIDTGMLSELVQANQGRKGFTYTHKYQNERNLQAIKHANDNGFTVNLSANSVNEVDKLVALNVGPVVTLLPHTQTTNTVTPGGNKVVVCPATYRDNVKCSTCGLCQKANRSCVVGFPAHGTAYKKASQVAA